MFLLLLVWFFVSAPSSDSWRIRPDLQRGRSLCTWSTCSTSWAPSGPGHGDGATLDLERHKQTLMENRQKQLLTDDSRRFWEQLVPLPGPERFLLLNNRPESTTWQSLVKLSGSDQISLRILFPQTFSGTYLSSVWSCPSLGLAAMFLPRSTSRCSCSGSAPCILVVVGYNTEPFLCVARSFSTSLNMCIILLQTVEHTRLHGQNQPVILTLWWIKESVLFPGVRSLAADAWTEFISRLDVGPVNLSVAAEAVWSGGLINGSSLAGETVCRDRSQSVHTAALHARTVLMVPTEWGAGSVHCALKLLRVWTSLYFSVFNEDFLVHEALCNALWWADVPLKVCTSLYFV